MVMTINEATLNDPVTLHMRRDFTQLTPEQTVGQALENLRKHQPEGRIIYFYVLDGEGKLQGVVPTRRLLLNPVDQKIADIMVKQVIAIPTAATVLDTCEFFTLHRFLAFPIVDEQRRMVGVVDVELYTDELNELEISKNREVDLFQLIGVHLTKTQMSSPREAFRTRFPWLICNLVGGILAAILAGLYEEELSKVVSLALFIPVVLTLAESVAMQSVSLALQTMPGRPTLSSLLGKLPWESLTGLLLGSATGLILSLVAFLWLRNLRVALCLLGGIGLGVACAAVIGLAMPNLLRLLRYDPKVAAGPVALAVADTVTLLLYFNFARWLLN